MSFIWVFLSGIVVVITEILFRRGLVWQESLWLVLPLSVFINYTIYKAITGAPTLLVIIVLFNAITILLRSLASQFILDEPVTKGNLVAAVTLGFGAAIGYLWR